MPAKRTTKPKKTVRVKPAQDNLRKIAAQLRKVATSFPGAHEDYPWGERVVKGPNDKVFVFLGDPYMLDGQLSFTVKLPRSGREVLKMPFAKPCGYGLGKHGWVTIRIDSDDRDVPPIGVMSAWVEESFAAVNAPAGARPKRR